MRLDLTPDEYAVFGIGIKSATYFKLVYVIHSGVEEYGIAHTAVFGMN